MTQARSFIGAGLFSLSLGVSFCLCLVGCPAEDSQENDPSKSTPEANQPPPPTPGGSSPQDAFDRYRKALKKKDAQAAFLVSSKDAQARMLTRALYEAHERAQPFGEPEPKRKAALAAILNKHGIAPDDLADPGKLKGHASQAKDGLGLYKALTRFVRGYLAADGDRLRPKKYSDLKKLEAKGDTAEAEVDELEDGRAVSTQRVRFTKVDGRWFLKIG